MTAARAEKWTQATKQRDCPVFLFYFLEPFLVPIYDTHPRFTTHILIRVNLRLQDFTEAVASVMGSSGFEELVQQTMVSLLYPHYKTDVVDYIKYRVSERAKI